ncbi:MAG: amidohydrolase [Elusimicrobiota bacterium]|jgi:hypothetical protein
MVDLLLKNGLIRTLDPARPLARSVACADGRVAALDEDPPAARVVDLQGATAVPGLVDAHVHLLWLGRRRLELDLAGVRDGVELLRRVAQRARTLPPGAWLRGGGHELREPPPARELSEAAGGRPVWLLRRDLHSGLASTRALELAGPALAGAPAGTVRAGGTLLVEEAAALMERVAPRPGAREAFLTAQKEALAAGLTAVHEAWVDEESLADLRGMDADGGLRLRVHAMVHDGDPARLAAFLRANKPTAGKRLVVRAAKLFLDGSLGSRTCWTSDPPLGGPRLSDAAFSEVARAALAGGWQLCVHAIGDLAVRQALGVYERLAPPPELRWRIEHLQHVHPSDFPRLPRWLCSIQPGHCADDLAAARGALCAALAEGTHAWRRMGRLVLGTDAPVAPLDPRRTFHGAVTGGGRPETALRPEEALRAMSADASWAGFSEAGILAPARPADLTVLERDWLECRPDEVLAGRVLGTVIDGVVEWEAE